MGFKGLAPGICKSLHGTVATWCSEIMSLSNNSVE